MTAATVTGLLNGAGLALFETVPWGTRPKHNGPGVYLVSLSPDPGATMALPAAPIDVHAVQTLLTARPELTWHGIRPDAQTLADAIATMWPPNQPVLYIGKAGTDTAHRVDQYYRTPLGARSPHAGGYPLKTLRPSFGLYVHVATTKDADEAKKAEEAMLDAFVAAVPQADRVGMCDPGMPIPFANLEIKPGRAKNHGIKGAREPRR